MFSDVLSQVIENIVKENFKAVVYKVKGLLNRCRQNYLKKIASEINVLGDNDGDI